MSQKIFKKLALLLAVVMILTGMPVYAHAAAAPAFQTTYSTFYENRANQGIYDIQVKNVQKGYILKWHITGKGKKWASFDTQKTIAKGTSVTNQLTIDSNGESAYAVGERIRITVNVYTAKWKLVNKITFAGKLQSKAKSVNIDTTGVSDLKQLKSGETYQFRAVMTPANATSKVYWTVTDAKGADCSSQITQDGAFTPTQSGEYTITATPRNSAKGAALCTKQVQVTVGTFIESIEQKASNRFSLTFGTAPAVKFKEADFSIKSGETTVVVKKVEYSQDGKTVDVTTSTSFTDGKVYTVSCAGYTKDFTASAGKPVKLKITTSSAQAGKYTTIEYAFYDVKNIDVTEMIKNGTFRYSANVTNGLLDQQTNKLFMTTIGSIASVTLEYTGIDGTRLSDTQTIVCVEQRAEEAAETKFTLTKSIQTPTFKDPDVREVAIGDTMYAHFAALDKSGAAIAYDALTYTSSDPDSLIVSSDGKLTPIKAGTVTIVVTAMQGTIPVTYSYDVTVKAGRYLASIKMKETAIAMSNVNVAGYQKIIPVTALDQYGEALSLTNATGIVTESYGRTVARYEPSSNSIIVTTNGASVGIYNCILALTAGGVTLNQNFTVIVSAPPMNGAYTYQVEASNASLDMGINENTEIGNVPQITIRLAEYRGGVFNDYVDFTGAQIRKGNTYYATDMITPITSDSAITATTNKMTLQPVQIGTAMENDGLYCRKAEQGIYTVTLKYNQRYSYIGTGSNENKVATVNIELTDTQKIPDYSIRSLTTSTSATNAFQVAADCIQVANGDLITDCTVTGSNYTGSATPVGKGEQIHISTITIRSAVIIKGNQKVYVDYRIPVGRTFTNR